MIDYANAKFKTLEHLTLGMEFQNEDIVYKLCNLWALSFSFHFMLALETYAKSSICWHFLKTKTTTLTPKMFQLKPTQGICFLVKCLHIAISSTKSPSIVKIFTFVAITQLQCNYPNGSTMMDHKPSCKDCRKLPRQILYEFVISDPNFRSTTSKS